ncbi:MAG: methyltransferase domain-containing protein [Oscillospiraceae bacterium]|nr:methyltransferase domain-containing protein [Oscillospiraceae bacterium]
MFSNEHIQKMNHSLYPLSSKYDPQWIIDNQMGSHCLWLTEALVKGVDLKPDMRVLDLGCGKALSSVFLAKEFNVQVWAYDLWVSANENHRRIIEAGAEKSVFPLKGNALEMPFADEFFDAVISINSIWSYGTGEDFVDKHLARVVKPGGQIGVVIPGMFNELSEPPEYLKPYWHTDFDSYHSPAWWRGLWEKATSINVDMIDAFENKEGVKIWRDFTQMLKPDESEDIMNIDNGRNITFLRLLARKNKKEQNND